MIIPMIKYSLVLFYKDYEAFLQKLQEIGLVDITTSSWAPNEKERSLVNKIDEYKKAIHKIKINTAKDKNPKQIKTDKASEKLDDYLLSTERLTKLEQDLAKINKEISELTTWGEFDKNHLSKLNEAGINISFYELAESKFEDFQKTWGEEYAISEINRKGINVYFVVATRAEEKVKFELSEIKAPKKTKTEALKEKQNIEKEINLQKDTIQKSASYINSFEIEINKLSNSLQLSKAVNSGEKAADGTLMVLEGWATEDSQAQVEKTLDECGTFYIKEKPTPEDETPVKLKNNKYSRLFEFIGGFYSLPKYGTTDMTPFFAPFYMIFFGFCLGDGGYGALFVLGGLYLIKKSKDLSMKRIGWLTIFCGSSTIIFGILTGSFFGIQLAEMAIFKPYKDMFFDPQKLFNLAISLGLINILFGMGVKIYGKIKYFGLKYALSNIGWFIVILSSIIAMLLPKLGIGGFYAGSTAHMFFLCIGVFLMLFCNTPGKNPIINFGTGLWNTYNDATSLLGDVLSYIRLFALGLAGGVLAMVFNDLAAGMSPNIPVVKQIIMLLILIVGHGINMFMSSLGAFVHPMRLTFVEFYKNSGFEAGQRAFNPLKKQNKKQ